MESFPSNRRDEKKLSDADSKIHPLQIIKKKKWRKKYELNRLQIEKQCGLGRLLASGKENALDGPWLSPSETVWGSRCWNFGEGNAILAQPELGSEHNLGGHNKIKLRVFEF